MALNFNRKPPFSDEDAENSQESNPLLQAANNNLSGGTPFAEKEEALFTALVGEDDEEELALRRIRSGESGAKNYTNYGDTNIENIIAASIARARKENPMGGVKASRFLTTKILMDAPPQYFAQFNDIVAEGVSKVQMMLSESGQANIISDAQEDPTNEEKQDLAYRVVSGYASSFLEGKAHRSTERTIINVLICNEIVGFGRLDPLWRDSSVDEIICNGPYDVQIERAGRLYKVAACQFKDVDHLMSLIERLYRAIGKTVARNTPIVGGRLHDMSRMEAVHTSIAPAGPNFVIRRHKEDYISPRELIEMGACSEELFTYLGNLIYKGCSVLVVGGTSTGKTTLLGALSGFIRPDHRVITLEDTLELKLSKNKLHAAAMECQIDRVDGNRGVTMQDLVKSTLRLRPEAIIVGEVRDGAAYDLCQALNTGHYGMSTVHANSEHDAIYRLRSLVSQSGLVEGESVLPLIAASFDVIVHLERFPTDGTRKVVSVSEVAPFPVRNEHGELQLPTNRLWRFKEEGLDDNYRVLGHWEKLNNISKERYDLKRLGLEKDLTWDALNAMSAQ